ncbi:MAG: LacI family transcriptional regulator [Actinobacteria bacterium]|nr:MAG: LacI family transcriptional regulator [Actinomycetota bacterium]
MTPPRRGADGEPRAAGRKATLIDVAAAAGVSTSTASRALSNDPQGRISDATRRRVLEAARSLGFAANVQARTLRTRSSMLIGVVVPDIAIAFYASALKGAQSALEAAGYQVLVMNSEREVGHELAALQTLYARQVDGVLIATSGGFTAGDVPVVFFDHVLKGVGLGYAAPDNKGGVFALVEHLVREHDHRRIAYIGAPLRPSPGVELLEYGPANERLEAFRFAMGSLMLPVIPQYLVAGDYEWSEASAEAAVGELLALPEPPTAIVAAGDTLALGALRGIRRAGRNVPDDIALVSFDDPVSADLLTPGMTALARHDRELGELGARLLLDALSRKEPPQPAEIRVPLELIVRGTCGCVHQTPKEHP